MACNSLKGLSITCGESLVGGASQIYVIAYKDLVNVLGTNEKYALDPVTGLVSEIGVAPAKAFVEIGIYPKASNGYSSAIAKDDTVGYFYFNQTVSFQLRGLSKENGDFIKDAGNQPVVFILKDKNGKYVVSGLNGQVTMETAEGGMGMVNDDGQSINLTFTGAEVDYVTFVDPTLMPLVLTEGCALAVITVEPADDVVADGSTATFAVTATGDTLSYQWQLNDGTGWTSIVGGTSASYTTPSLVVADDGNMYRVIVSNQGVDCGLSKIYSSAAIVNVTP